MERFTKDQLWAVRNKVPIRTLIKVLDIPTKESEGVFRFLCPVCCEFQTSVHPHENLARCFRCQRNFNPIELVMAERSKSFVDSVKGLLKLRDRIHDRKKELSRKNEALQSPRRAVSQ